MKKILFTILALNSMLLFAQTINKPAPTTEEEYNYMTKGYKIQLESGLDMKKGYAFKDMDDITRDDYNYKIKLLIREEKEEVAGYLFIIQPKYSSKPNYIALPINNSVLLERYSKDLSILDGSLIRSYCVILSAYLGAITSVSAEQEKQANK
jgi:hypothetical protein